jgi:hypothetical protein
MSYVSFFALPRPTENTYKIFTYQNKPYSIEYGLFTGKTDDLNKSFQPLYIG